MSEDWELFLAEPFEPALQTILDNVECQQKPPENLLCCFDCLGEVDTKKIQLNDKSYFKSNFFSLTSQSSSSAHNSKYGKTLVFNRKLDKGFALYKHLDSLFKMNSKQIMQLERGADAGVTFFGNISVWNNNCHKNFKDLRFDCLEFLLFLQRSIEILCSDEKHEWLFKELYPVIRKNLKALLRQLGKLKDLPDCIQAHTSNPIGNKSAQASYHLVHLHLDIRWQYLVILRTLSSRKGFFSDCNVGTPYSSENLGMDKIIGGIQLLVLELLELSLKRFEKIELINLRRKSPFGCSCIQELWMLIIKLTNELQACNVGKTFWEIVASYLDINMIQAPLESEIVKFHELNLTNFSIFSLWILCHVARLQKHCVPDSEDNYSLLDSNLKVLFNSDLDEGHLRTIMALIETLCLEIWEPKPETMLILWDHFHKKINTSFYIPGAPPSTLAVISKTPKGLLHQLKSYLESMSNVNDSFQHFLRIIGLHLQRSQKIPRHWNLLKGRLYSKLTFSKLETLSSIGEYHFISLYIILAISQDIQQIESKMIEIVTTYLNKRNCLTEQLIKGQLGLVLLALENDKDASAALQPVAQYMKSLSITENIDIFRLYVETFQDILQLNVPLNLGQHLLIDKWISDYLSISSETDVSRLLDSIVLLLTRLKQYCDFESPEQNIIMMIENLWDELKCYLERANSLQSTPHQVSGIAASLAIISMKIHNKERLTEIVKMFAFRGVTDISVLRQFVCLLSQHEEINSVIPNFDKFIMKTWIKCCFLCSDAEHFEMKELTKTISRLPEITDLLGEKASSLAYSSEPFLDFISSLHNIYAVEDFTRKQALRDRVSIYFEGLEKWVRPIVTTSRDSGKILSLYRNVGQMFQLISPLLYIKSKPNTLLQQLVDLFLLPISVRNPEAKLHPHVLGAVKASLHLFFEGLIYLDPESDHYIMRVLKELIQVYIPHCMNSQNQNVLSYGTFGLINAFGNYDNSSRQLILEILASNFFKRKSRNPHPFANLALKFIKELLNNHNTNEDVLFCLVENILERICDMLMYSEEKSSTNNSAKDILILILNSKLLRNSTRAMDGVMKMLTSLCKENLAFSSKLLFDLLVTMTKVAPDLIRRFTPTLLEQVKFIEAKRGVGYDRTLRLGIERVEISLRTIKEAT